MQPITSSSAYDLPSASVPQDTASGVTDIFGGGNIDVSNQGASTSGFAAGPLDSEIEQTGAAAVEALTLSIDQSGSEVAGIVASLSALVSERLTSLDVTDTADVMLFQSTLENLMATSLSMPEINDPALGLMAGIADTTSAALSFAKADPALFDPTAGAESIATTVSALLDLSQAFESIALGETEYMQTAFEELYTLKAVYPTVAQPALDAGIPVTSLLDPSPQDPSADAFPSDGLGAETNALDALQPEEDQFLDPSLSDPAAQEDTAFADMMAGDSEESLDALDALGLDELIPDEMTTGTETDDASGFAEMMAGDTTAEPSMLDDMTGEEMLPDEAQPPTLDTESSTDGTESDANQDALEARFQNLYVSLMEKQISFKEAVEAYKTDNQNAGKG